MEVVEITAPETHALRRAVLRNGDPGRSVEFPEDTSPGTFHVGIRSSAGLIVATSSWFPKPFPESPDALAVQLRGMAIDAALQGSGLGGLLLEAALARCSSEGFELMWARARDSALGFYTRHGCRIVGDGFVDAATELPHHIVVRELS